jgi:hypothetical protein
MYTRIFSYCVCGKKARRTRNSTNSPSTLDYIDCVEIGGIDTCGTTKGSHKLRKHIHGDLFPGKAAEHGEGESDLLDFRHYFESEIVSK